MIITYLGIIKSYLFIVTEAKNHLSWELNAFYATNWSSQMP